MKVVVLGGHGHLGSRVAQAIAKVAGVTVEVAGRKGPCLVDLQRPDTFSALDDANVVIDFASTRALPPEPLIARCLARGITYFVGSSDISVVRRAHAHFRESKGPGSLILGAGIFTGISNLLARAAQERTEGCDSIELGITMHPYSGAGQGTVDLMVDVLDTPTLRYENGRAVEGPPMLPGPRLPFPEGAYDTLVVPLPEAFMLYESLRVPNVTVSLGPKPSPVRAMFRSMPLWLLRSRLFRLLMRANFSFIRKVVLKGRATRVEMVARARSAAGEALVKLSTDDGMGAGGFAVGGMISLLAKGVKPEGACLFVDQVFPLDATIEASNALATPQTRMRVETERMRVETERMRVETA